LCYSAKKGSKEISWLCPMTPASRQPHIAGSALPPLSTRQRSRADTRRSSRPRLPHRGRGFVASSTRQGVDMVDVSGGQGTIGGQVFRQYSLKSFGFMIYAEMHLRLHLRVCVSIRRIRHIRHRSSCLAGLRSGVIFQPLAQLRHAPIGHASGKCTSRFSHDRIAFGPGPIGGWLSSPAAPEKSRPPEIGEIRCPHWPPGAPERADAPAGG